MSSLIMDDIYKSFGETTVLKGISFTAKKGEVHALLGMNGAGKSTLMKILSGDYKPDHGTITIDGKTSVFHHPSDAKKAGIGFVVQEVDTALFPTLTVYENVANIPDQKSAAISYRKLKADAKKLLQRVGLSINVSKLVQECTLQEKQLILLAKTLSASAAYIILDEPTAPLSDTETKTLFKIIRQLRAEGAAIIYISHKLSEVKEICDRVTILRDGSVVHTGDASEIEIAEIVRHMIGTAFQIEKRKKGKTFDKPLFHAENIVVEKFGSKLSLNVHEGEIVGVAGLAGAGKTELAEALYGLSSTKASIVFRGKQVKITSPAAAIKSGICLIPEERRKQGLFVHEPVSVNLSIQSLRSIANGLWISKQKEQALANRLISRLNISAASPSISTSLLSGGNQQKVVIGKWLNTDSSLFLFDEPTKGIDVGAKKEVFQLIHKLAGEGKGIVYFSGEWEELLEVADRIIILNKGKVAKVLTHEEATIEKLIYYASGGEDDGGSRRHQDKKTKEHSALSV
ncbi:sugar ABC transporter ATP-binding protein [Bacillus sp. F19]|nr:sugar ABC transporter ATP-binding protein [Bacillus sp. F19]